MEKISVKAVEGRVAFTAPRGGAKIPSDKYVEVDKTPWIMRLLEKHGDIVQEKASKKSQAKPSEPASASSTDPAK